MSFIFGGSTNLPAIDQRPFGLQQARTATNQQARPIPLLYGQQRLGVTFLCDVFNPFAIQVTQSTGKQASNVGNNYYASFAALVCMGPVDGLFDVFLNGQPVFLNSTQLFAVALLASGTSGAETYTATFQTAAPHGLSTGDVVSIFGADQLAFNGEFVITVVSATQFQYQIVPVDVAQATDFQYGSIYAQVRLPPVLRGNGDFVNVTLPGYGDMIIFWGTETQQPSTYLNTQSGNTHPAYLGQCYIVFNQLFFGFNQTNVPNIELVIAKWPLPTWAAIPHGFVEDDANPAYVIADLLQNQRGGLALPDDLLNTDDFNAAAEQFSSTENLGISYPLDRSQDLRSILTGICETVDLLPLLDDNYNLTLLPIRPASSLAGLTTVQDDDLADLPVFQPADWSSTYTDVKAIFSDASLQFMDNLMEWRDIGQKNIFANPDTLLLDRHWISRADLAQTIANVTGQAAAIPAIKGSLKLRYNAALWENLSPGSIFLINTSLRSTTNLVFRVLSREMPNPETPEFNVDFQADRTYLYSALIAAAKSGSGGSSETFPTVPPLLPIPVNNRLLLFELPCGLCPGSPALACIVARASSITTSFSIWLNKNYAWSGAAPDSYGLIESPSVFAFHGFTQSDYPATTQNIDLLLGVVVQLDGPDTTLNPITAFEALSDTMLAFMDEEILSLAEWTLLNSGQYQLQFIRGRFGTPIQDHVSGTQLLMIPRSSLAIISQPSFQPGNTAQIKITLANGNVSDSNVLSQTFAGTAWRVPAPVALTVNGNNINAVFPGGPPPVVVSWILPDPGGILPRFDQTTLSTRLTFISGSATVTVDVAWPNTSYTFVFGTLMGVPDANFSIVAETTCSIGFETMHSFSAATLNVLKYP